jgi:hypothetical protein
MVNDMWLFDNLTIAPWAGWLTVILASWGLMSTIAVGTWRAASRAWDRPPPAEDLELPPLPPERSWADMTGPQTAVDDRIWECPVCHDWSPEPGFCYRDHREDPGVIMQQNWRPEYSGMGAQDIMADIRSRQEQSYAWGPAALPRPDPRSQLAALMADVMGPEDERLAAPIVPEWVNADLEAAGFKTYETNTAAVDSMVMRAIQ